MAKPDGPPRRAARWLESGLLDVEFYAALRAREFADATEAAADFVAHGMPQRLSPHPFLDFVSLPSEVRRAWRDGKVTSVLAHLTGEDGRMRPTGPLAEPVDPASARADMLALAQRLGREAAGQVDPGPGPVDWRAVALEALRPDRTSFVVLATEPRRTLRTVQKLLERSGDGELEVVVLDCGSAPHAALGLLASLYGRAQVELLRLPGTAASAATTAAANVGIARATGRVVVLLDSQVVVRRGWLPGCWRLSATRRWRALSPSCSGPTTRSSPPGSWSALRATGRRPFWPGTRRRTHADSRGSDCWRSPGRPWCCGPRTSWRWRVCDRTRRGPSQPSTCAPACSSAVPPASACPRRPWSRSPAGPMRRSRGHHRRTPCSLRIRSCTSGSASSVERVIPGRAAGWLPRWSSPVASGSPPTSCGGP